tara:strand:- start:2475 stop:3905 length:1431 start_codon:yes stop_codon:yes gene_type:complete
MTELQAPHNLDAEKIVLGGVLLDPTTLDSIQSKLEPTDFYKISHAIIYEAMAHLAQKGEVIEPITLSHYLETKGQLEQVGGSSYMAELVEANMGDVVNIDAYVNIVANTSTLRKMLRTSKSVMDRIYRGEYESVDSFINQVEGEFFQLAENKNQSEIRRSVDVVKETMKYIEELYKKKAEVTGIPTGFKDLDKITAGLHAGDLCIIAARPSMGKTAFSLNIAQNVALREKKSVAYFSLEMGSKQLMLRMFASEAKINMGKLKVGKIDEWQDLITAASRFSDANFFIDETSSLSPYELRARCRRIKAQKGLDMIIIDYLQLMDLKRPSESRERVISEISKTLKEIAKELQIPVVALAQLNRGVESRTDRRPMLSDLRESGSIEQDADIIMMLYRDEYYEKENSEYKGQAEVIISKHRNGPTGTVRLAFRAEMGTFMDLAPASFEPGPEASQRKPKDFVEEKAKKKGPVKNFAPGIET